MLALCPLSTIRATTYTVCLSGCDYTTIVAAVAAAGSTDIIEIQETRNESITLDKNIAGFTSDTGSRRWWYSGGVVLTVNNGLTQPMTVSGIDLDCTSANTAYRINTVGTNAEWHIVDCKIRSNGGNGLYQANSWGLTELLNIQRCEFDGYDHANSQGMDIKENSINTIVVANSIFRDHGTDGICTSETNSADTIDVLNCTFDNNGDGIDYGTRGTFTNNIFTNNTDDVSLSGNGNDADFTYSAFEEQGSPFGSNNIFSITSTDEYVNEGADNFQLKDTAQSRNAGTNTGLADDFAGNDRPVDDYDIGAYENQTPLAAETFTSTPTYTYTLTPTYSYTYTDSPTYSETPTATPTYSYTYSDTSTYTYSDTPTYSYTYTDTPTYTYSDTPTYSYTDTPTYTYSDTPTYSYTYTPTYSYTDTSTYSYTDTPTYSYTYTPTYSYTYTPTYSYTYTPTYSYTYTDTPTYTYSHTPTYSYTHTPTYSYTDTPTYSYTYTPTYSYTHTPTYTVTPTYTYTNTPTHSYTYTNTSTYSETPTRTPMMGIMQPNNYYWNQIN